MDLVPKGASLQVKFSTNSLPGHPERDSGRNYVGLRLSRANHDCRPNAGHVYDEIARVVILFAQQDIQIGEEICIYYSNTSSGDGYQRANDRFAAIWGFTCPVDCPCKNLARQQIFLEAVRLQKQMTSLAQADLINDALNVGEMLLDVHLQLNFKWISRFHTHFDLFKIAFKDSKMRDRALKHLKASYQLISNLCPYSKVTSELKKIVDTS